MSEFPLSWALTHLGCWGEAQRLLVKSLSLWSKNQNVHVVCMRRLSLALLSIEAGDFAGALRQYDEARALCVGHIDPTLYFAERAGRVRAYVGLEEFELALACFAELTQASEQDGVLMDAYSFLLLHLGLAECWLAQGDLSRARQEARRLCAGTERPPERTYLGHGHRLLAQIAMAEQDWDEANAEIDKALEIVSAAEVPLAAWRVHATAASLFDCQVRSSEATAHRRRASEVIDSIGASLEPTDPLRTWLCAHRFAQAP